MAFPFRRRLVALLVALPAAVAGPAFGAADNLLSNPSFETKIAGSGWFGLWELDARIAARGQQSRTRLFMRDGRFGFKLMPNENNATEPSRLGYGIYQLLPAAELRGKPILFQGWINAAGGAEAVLRVVAVTEAGESFTRVVSHSTRAHEAYVPPPALKRDIFEVPDLPIQFLFLVCSVEGTSGVAYFDDVAVSVEEAARWKQGVYDPGPALSAGAAIDYHDVRREIPRSLYGINILYPSGGYGLWSSEHGRANPVLVDLTRELSPASLRFPGGGFANFYHWRNGVGPVSSRPLTEIAPGEGVTGNEFGTDEALQLAELLDAPLFVTVNAGTGTAQEAADWVRHVNRAGRKVDYWEIGNELYFAPDPSNPASGPSWLPSRYAKQYLEFARAMRAADPGIKLGADMEFNLGIRGCGVLDEGGCWSDVLLRETAHEIDFLALHSGLTPIIVGWDPGWDVRTVYASMLASPILVTRLLDELATKVDRLAGPRASRIEFAMTEWGPLFQSDPRSRFIDHSQTLGSALFVASMMKALIEHPRVMIAHGFNLVDTWTSGWIGERDGKFAVKAPYYAFQLFARHFGSQLLATRVNSPLYDARSIGLVGAVENVPYLDLVSSRNPDRGDLRIVAVNKHFDRPIRVSFRVRGFEAAGADAWTLTGTAIDANTGTQLPAGLPQGLFAPQAVAEPDGRFLKGGPDEISFDRSAVEVRGGCFEIEFPARSATALVIRGTELQPGEERGCSRAFDELALESCLRNPSDPRCWTP